MHISTHIIINQSAPVIWAAITDIANAKQMISNILKLEVLHQPPTGLVGLKWQETRKMFGNEESETMWITEAKDHHYYCTRAESHGCVYQSRLEVTQLAETCQLTMSFNSEAQTLTSKILFFIMSPFIKRAMLKELNKDLLDIKAFVEQTPVNK
ncbi:SRPBCC family protein [Paraglaciecola aestuariivivens]